LSKDLRNNFIRFPIGNNPRHPLDTIASLRVGIAKNWGHHPKPPDWRDWLARPLVERCAHHWAYLNTVGYEAVRHLATVTRFSCMVSRRLSATMAVRRLRVDMGLLPVDIIPSSTAPVKPGRG